MYLDLYIGCIIGLSQGPENVLLRCDCGREIYIWYCSWEAMIPKREGEGGDVDSANRNWSESNQASLPLHLVSFDWFGKDPNHHHRSPFRGFYPLKVTASSKGCYYILLSTVQTPYCTVQLYRVSLSTVDFTVFLLAPRASPQHHCQNVCTRCHTCMSRHNKPDGESNSKCLFVAAKPCVATFVWTISLVPTNVALNRISLSSWILHKGQKGSIFRSRDGCYQYFHWSWTKALRCTVHKN